MTLSDKKTLDKVIDGTSSKEEAQHAVNWLSSTIEGQQVLAEMIDRDAYLLEERTLINNPITDIQSKLLHKRIEKEIRNKEIKHFWLQTAAVLIPLIFIISTGIYLNSRFDLFIKPTYAELYIPKGEKARVLFQDGTEVYLNSDTKIKYPKKFGLTKRTVQLQGEAYFKVAPNRNRPFIVETENSSIKVLGTSFNVNAYENDKKIAVALDEGVVLFNSPRFQYQLSPGECVIYDKASGVYDVNNLLESENLSLWTNDVLFLSDTPLDEVLRKLERRFNVNFNIEESLALDYTYTLTTKESNIDIILSELERIAPVQFTLDNDRYIVSLQ